MLASSPHCLSFFPIFLQFILSCLHQPHPLLIFLPSIFTLLPSKIHSTFLPSLLSSNLPLLSSLSTIFSFFSVFLLPSPFSLLSIFYILLPLSIPSSPSSFPPPPPPSGGMGRPGVDSPARRVDINQVISRVYPSRHPQASPRRNPVSEPHNFIYRSFKPCYVYISGSS